MLKKLNKYKFLILAVILSIPSFVLLFHRGFPLTDDGNWMIIRLSAFYESLRAGQFPVRFLLRLNNGFGYPVADFLYPLFLYIGSFIHIVGFNFTQSVKVILGFSLFSSSVFTYLWLKKTFGTLASVVGSVVYTYFPYHLYDVYKRGSVGEVVALSLVPLILWQIERKSLLFTSFGIFLLLLSHNTLALFFVPLVFIYGLLKNMKLLRFLLVSFGLGALSASFFIIPALYDTRYTVFGLTSVSDFYSYFLEFKDYNLLASVFVVILFSSIYLAYKTKYKKNNFLIFSIVSSFVVLFLTLPISKPLWEMLPFKQYIQFPFRLISFLVVFSAFQAAVVVQGVAIRNKIRFSIAALIVLLSFICAVPFLKNIDYQEYPDSFYSTNLDTTTVRDEYMPKWVKEIPQNYPQVRVFSEGSEKINVSLVSAKTINFDVFLNTSRDIFVNVVYFPGWKANVNGKEQDINYDNKNGLISLKLFKGANNVNLVFKETDVRLLSDILSIIGIVAIFGLSYYTKRHKLL